MARDDRTERPKSDATDSKPGIQIRRWALADLLGECREAIIEHGGETYRLRLTANKKLILTK